MDSGVFILQEINDLWRSLLRSQIRQQCGGRAADVGPRIVEQLEQFRYGLLVTQDAERLTRSRGSTSRTFSWSSGRRTGKPR